MGWHFAKILSVVITVLGIVFFLYIWRLGSFTPGLSASEQAAINASSSLHDIRVNPINAPHKLVQLVLRHVGSSDAFWMRLASVLFAIAFLIVLFLLLRKWFGNFIGALGTLLFVSVPWVILLGRSANSDVMFFSPLLVIFAYSLLSRSNKNLWAWFGLMLSLAIAIYTPGILWFILLSLVFGYKRILALLSKMSSHVAVGGMVFLILLLTPLVYGLYQDTTLAKTLLALPDKWPNAMEIIKSAVWAVVSLAAKTRFHVDYNIGRLPLLNAAQVVLALMGLYAMSKKARAQLCQIGILIFIGIALSAINNNPVVLSVCLPAVIILATAGLRFLSVRWFKVFPLNPLPRALAIALICLVVTFNLAYSVRYALAAWPHTADTRKIYMLK